MSLQNAKNILENISDDSCVEIELKIKTQSCPSQSGNTGNGISGLSGLSGLPGSASGVGTSGISGLSGAKGDKGDKGNDGSIGISGLSGLPGSASGAGTSGLSGLSGSKGDKGDNGQIGVSGISGMKGKDGGSTTINNTEGPFVFEGAVTQNGKTFTFVGGSSSGGSVYNQVSTQEQFETAVKSSSGQYTLLPGTYLIKENITLNKNVKLVFLQGAQVTINQGSTFTVEGRIEADDYYKIWTVNGILDLGPMSMSYASVCHFGAVPDGVTDSTQAFKDTVKAAQRLTIVKMPMGAQMEPYIISDTIEFWTYLYPGFYGWKVFGEKTDMNGYVIAGTAIKYTAKSKPCFNFKSQRLSHIYSFSIEGVNEAPSQLVYGNQTPDIKVWDRNNWVSEGVQLEGPDHLAGIAIDWNPNNTPPLRCSAQMHIFDVQIGKMVVGLSISPINLSQQADTIDTLKLKTQACVYGVSVAQDQARSCTFTNSFMDGNFACYTNMAYGEGRGSAFNIFGGQYTTNFKLFECTAAARGNCSINGIFTEANGIIGSWHGLGCNVNSVVFTGCEFGLDDNAWESDQWGSWITPVVTMEAGTNIVFNGCTFNSRKKMLGFSGNKYTFIGSSFCQTQKVFFMYDPTIIGTMGPHNCGGDDWRDWADNIENHVSTRKQVRPKVKTAYIFGKTPEENVNLKNYVGSWYGIEYREMPNTNEKYFYWTVGANEAKKFMVGDLINGYASAANSGNSIYGMQLGWGETQIPAFEVMEINGNVLKLRRTGPEVVTSYPNESKYGSIWIGNDTFYVYNHPETLGEGNVVLVKGQNNLQVGDVVNINGVITRILNIENNLVSFADSVPVGKIKSISHE